MPEIPAAFAPPVLNLPFCTAKIPKSARAWESDPSVVKIRSFTVGQELDAAAASNASAHSRFEYELIDRCTVEVDGKPHDQATSLIERCSPKVRVLLTRALNKFAMPTDQETADFEAGLEVSV